MNLEQIKLSRLNKLIQDFHTIILEGIPVTVNDKTYNISQNTINFLFNEINTEGKKNIPFHAEDELCREYSIEDIHEIMSAYTKKYQDMEKIYLQLKEDIKISESAEEILNIDIFDKYKGLL